jgi:regulator of replication initiation timing
MAKHEPLSAELQQLLDENDALQMEIVQLRGELTRKDRTIDQLELKDRPKAKRMGDLHEQIYARRRQ